MTTRLAVTVALALLLASATTARAATGAVKGTVTSDPSTPVANAVVMIEGLSQPAAADAPHAVMDQRNDAFLPHVLAVPVGTTVDFVNSDSHLHNVGSDSRTMPFDLGMYAEGKRKSITFDKPGVVPLRCNVHPKMEAFIVVHANPYVAVTDERGEYTITGVPVGSYSARVWHQSLAEKTVPVEVREQQVGRLDVRLEKRH